MQNIYLSLSNLIEIVHSMTF